MPTPIVCGSPLGSTWKLTVPGVNVCPPLVTFLGYTGTYWYGSPSTYGYNHVSIFFEMYALNIQADTADFTLKVYDHNGGAPTLIDSVLVPNVNCCGLTTVNFACTALNRYAGCSATSGPTIKVEEQAP